MNPIELLMAEHRLIERALDALEGIAERAATAEDRTTLGKAVTFFRDFADRRHHGKEEDILFRALERHGMPSDGGPVGMMLEEHGMGRDLVGRLAGVASGEGPLGDEERGQVRRAAADYSLLLRQHIQKEDQILYPMALQVLPATAQIELAGEFEDFEAAQGAESSLERMEALAHSLAEAAAS